VSSPDPSAADDQQIVALVGRAVARDQVTFGELYDLYLDRVYRYVYYRTANRTDAEDLAEQVFLHAWAAIERFRWRGQAVSHLAVRGGLQRRRRLASSTSTLPVVRGWRQSDRWPTLTDTRNAGTQASTTTGQTSQYRASK